MDDTLLFIPPCCVDKKLPQAIMQAPRRALTFYTHGDVSMEKMYRAISYLVSDPHVMVLTMPSLSHQTLAFLRQCFEREWITDLVLSTCRDVSTLVKTYLADFSRHVLYTHDDNVSLLSSHLVLYTDTQMLSINGPMWEISGSYSLAAYTMFFQPNYDISAKGDFANPLMNILLPDVLRMRKQYNYRDDLSVSAWLHRFIKFSFPPYSD